MPRFDVGKYSNAATGFPPASMSRGSGCVSPLFKFHRRKAATRIAQPGSGQS